MEELTSVTYKRGIKPAAEHGHHHRLLIIEPPLEEAMATEIEKATQLKRIVLNDSRGMTRFVIDSLASTASNDVIGIVDKVFQDAGHKIKTFEGCQDELSQADFDHLMVQRFLNET